MLGAPTDAEFATYILQKRSRANKPLRGQKTLKRMAKKRARGHSVSESISSITSARENVQVRVLRLHAKARSLADSVRLRAAAAARFGARDVGARGLWARHGWSQI